MFILNVFSKNIGIKSLTNLLGHGSNQYEHGHGGHRFEQLTYQLLEC